MYNMLFGKNPQSDVILGTLGLSKSDVGRFRDVFVTDGKIAIYTRNGGGNREDYKGVFEKLAAHPCYLSDTDDDFDCTYATIYFRFPDEFADALKSISSDEPFDPDARWLAMLESIRVGGIPAQK